jgi:hypothetical protein
MLSYRARSGKATDHTHKLMRPLVCHASVRVYPHAESPSATAIPQHPLHSIRGAGAAARCKRPHATRRMGTAPDYWELQQGFALG